MRTASDGAANAFAVERLDHEVPAAQAALRRGENPGPSRHTPAPAPLPPLGRPVADILQALRERADAGDAAAACRLAAEIARCAEVEHFDADQAAQQLQLAITVDEHGNRHADLAMDYILRQVQRQERCRGVDASLLLNQARFDLAAAELGDLDAAFRFVRAESLQTGVLLRHPELLELYRQRAWPLFLRLFEAGHPFAPVLWQSATGKRLRFNPLGAVIPPEWDRPEVARALRERQGGPWPERDTLAPSPSPEATAEAEHLFQTYFAASPLRPSGSAPPPPHIDPARCEAMQ